MKGNSAIVVGAGILGLAMARSLAGKGYRVKVFEQSNRARGASIRNFGMIWPIGQPDGKLYERALRTKSVWMELAQQKVFWCDQVGSLHVANNSTEWDLLQEVVESMSKTRLVRLLTPSGTKSISPYVKSYHLLGSMYSAEEMIVDPLEALNNLPAYFSEQFPIEFFWSKKVVEVQTGKIRLSDKTTVEAELVFICSGAEFDTLYPDYFSNASLTKCKLQMMQMELGNMSKRIGPALCGGLSLYHYKSFHDFPSFNQLAEKFKLEFGNYLKEGIHVMVSQNQQGLLTIGDSHEYGNDFDPYVRSHVNQMILDYLSSIMHTEELKPVKMWTGVYAKLMNQDTEMFHSPEEGVFLVNGVGGAGMTMSFGLADEICNEF